MYVAIPIATLLLVTHSAMAEPTQVTALPAERQPQTLSDMEKRCKAGDLQFCGEEDRLRASILPKLQSGQIKAMDKVGKTIWSKYWNWVTGFAR